MKNSSDTLHRFLFENAPIRGEIVHLDHSWRSVLLRHHYPEPLRNVLGELCAAAVLLAATLKLQGSLILQIQGRGAVQLLVVECTGDLQLRATAHWTGDLTDGNLREWVGDGRFVITLDPKNGDQAYQGIVALEGDTVSEMLQNYMTRSEQLDTYLCLAADGEQAAGLMLQKLPEQLEDESDHWSRVCQLADTLKGFELLNLASREVLHRLYHEEDIRLFDPQDVIFNCACSRENVARMLKMLGREEIISIFQERDEVEVFCEFCHQRYAFDAVDAEAVFNELTPVLNSETRH
jgi:molecular chaperone Hsp33